MPVALGAPTEGAGKGHKEVMDFYGAFAGECEDPMDMYVVHIVWVEDVVNAMHEVATGLATLMAGPLGEQKEVVCVNINMT
eukprot:11278747-Ditylum_brightwellii.AAC.1